eukprot:SM001100S18756  [mRNA]  locus=s1100:225:1468:+ [translate_table: standard]
MEELQLAARVALLEAEVAAKSALLRSAKAELAAVRGQPAGEAGDPPAREQLRIALKALATARAREVAHHETQLELGYVRKQLDALEDAAILCIQAFLGQRNWVAAQQDPELSTVYSADRQCMTFFTRGRCSHKKDEAHGCSVCPEHRRKVHGGFAHFVLRRALDSGDLKFLFSPPPRKQQPLNSAGSEAAEAAPPHALQPPVQLAGTSAMEH